MIKCHYEMHLIFIQEKYVSLDLKESSVLLTLEVFQPLFRQVLSLSPCLLHFQSKSYLNSWWALSSFSTYLFVTF